MVVKKVLQRLHCFLLTQILLFVGYHVVVVRYVNGKYLDIETRKAVSLINEDIVVPKFVVYVYPIGHPNINRIALVIFQRCKLLPYVSHRKAIATFFVIAIHAPVCITLS